MLKAVVFDFGGVLSLFGAKGDNTKRFAQVLGCDANLIEPKLGPMIGRWMSGKLDTEEFWREAAEAVGVPVADYVGRWSATEPHNYNHEYYEFARALQQEGIRTGICSNVNPTSEHLIRGAGGYKDFAPVILSCEVGAFKPNPEIYRYLLRALQLPPQEVLFVDDMPENIAAAAALGMHTLQAHEPRDTMKQILIDVVRSQDPAGAVR